MTTMMTDEKLTTSAKVIADSIYSGSRLTTIEVTMHRFVLAEFNTHRVFSRNSASSRAIPVEKQLEKIKASPAWPIEWPCEQAGMQGGTELPGSELLEAQLLFERIRDFTVSEIEKYLPGRDKPIRLHKSVLNRVLEPFMWHTVIVTSTEWQNFFDQRCSPLAQPEIRVAAEMMQEVYNASTPAEFSIDSWHLPYVTEKEMTVYTEDTAIKASVARCARVSSLHHDGVKSIEKDLDLFDKLMQADPPHWSPLEHVAQVVGKFAYATSNFDYPWQQLRHHTEWFDKL